jgi:hypothetical protein
MAAPEPGRPAVRAEMTGDTAPPLRPVRWNRASRRHRARPPIARCPQSSRSRARRPRPTARPKHPRLRGGARVAAAGWSSSRRSRAPAPRDRPRRAGSGSHLMIDGALPSASQRRFFPPRAPEQEADVLTRSPVPLQPPRMRPPLAASSAKKLVVSTPAANSLRRQRPKSRERFDRQAKICRARQAEDAWPSWRFRLMGLTGRFQKSGSFERSAVRVSTSAASASATSPSLLRWRREPDG